MPRPSAPNPEAVRPPLPLFEGFPFLATRLIPAGCHITLLPDRWSRPQLLALLEQQVAANQFDAALVLSADEAHYRWPGDPRVVIGPAPRSTAIFIGGLLTPEPLDPETLGDRPQRLRAFSAGVNHGGILFGDPQKGGRTATPDEIARLRGRVMTQATCRARNVSASTASAEWDALAFVDDHPGASSPRSDRRLRAGWSPCGSHFPEAAPPGCDGQDTSQWGIPAPIIIVRDEQGQEHHSHRHRFERILRGQPEHHRSRDQSRQPEHQDEEWLAGLGTLHGSPARACRPEHAVPRDSLRRAVLE